MEIIANNLSMYLIPVLSMLASDSKHLVMKKERRKTQIDFAAQTKMAIISTWQSTLPSEIAAPERSRLLERGNETHLETGRFRDVTQRSPDCVTFRKTDVIPYSLEHSVWVS